MAEPQALVVNSFLTKQPDGVAGSSKNGTELEYLPIILGSPWGTRVPIEPLSWQDKECLLLLFYELNLHNGHKSLLGSTNSLRKILRIS